ncbi:E1-E2 ATPase-domain-containing protein [Cytidiella melzeri]|nr:E1-E2 ATPase-domain-containing protein [Cytidiella melzeri]
MSPSCCGGSGGKTVADAQHILVGSDKPKSVEDIPAESCCSDSGCGCDDNCLDELARAICAEDDAHIHSKEGSVSSEETCKCDEVTDVKSLRDNVIIKAEPCVSPEIIPAASLNDERHSCGLRKRKLAKTDLPSKACGQHVSEARNRQKDTLAAFGCICRAMLAKGLQSCCSTRPPILKSGNAPSLPSLRKTHRGRPSFDSCCGGSGTSRKSIDSCCSTGACCKVESGSLRSVRRQSRVSLDSCAGKSCCAGYADSDADLEKDAITLEKNLSHNRAVLAVKGMTCTGCENKLVRALRSQSAIINVKTSLVLSRAEFDYTCDAQDLPALIQALQKRTGFALEQIAATSTARMIDIHTPLREKLLLATMPDGVQQITKVAKGQVRVVYSPRVIGARDIFDCYAAFSPTLAPVPEDPALAAGAMHIKMLLLRTVVSLLLTVPVLVMAWAPLPSHPRAYGISSLTLATAVQFAIAGPFYVAALKSLLSRLIETDLLIVLSTTTAYIYSVVAFAYQMIGRPLDGGSFFETSTLLVTLIMFGQLASAFARQRAVAAISLRSLQQQSATLVTTRPDGREEEVVIDARLLQYEDIFRVHSNSSIITDGVVVAGTSTVDESTMTGESLPLLKSVGSEVLAGTTNGPGALLVKVARLPGENTISDIANMVDEARFSRARIQSIVDRVCTWFVPVVLALAVVTFIVWLVVGIHVRHQKGGDAAVRALTYAVAVLAISCPCAIGLAVPMVVLVASGVAAKLGIVFREAATIESARKTAHVVFDKTGTLTMGQLQVVKAQVFQETVQVAGAYVNTESVIAALSSASKHPVARALSAYLTAATPCSALQEVEEVTGKGMQGKLDGQLLQGGNAEWLHLGTNTAVGAVLAAGHTAFCVTFNNTLIAVFSLTDTLRPEAKALVAFLRDRNIQVAILSGDHERAVQCVASELDVPPECYRASCLPSDKAAFISELQAQGGTVMFCGDGTNDSVALAQADIGIHMSSEASGAGAAAAASAASDAVLIRPSLEGIRSLIELSEAVHRRILTNFLWAFVYNLVAILFAAGAFVDARIAPAYAGLGELVSVLPVVLIAMHLRLFKSKSTV